MLGLGILHRAKITTASALLLALTYAQQPAQTASFDPADVYYQAWLFSRDADNLSKENRHVEALEKLVKAKQFLETIQKYQPEWKKEMLQGRFDVTQKEIAKITPLAQQQDREKSAKIAELSGSNSSSTKNLMEGNTTSILLEDNRMKHLEEEVTRLRNALNQPGNENGRDAIRADDLRRQRDDLRAQLNQALRDLNETKTKMSSAPLQGEMARINQKLYSLEQENDAMKLALHQSRSEQTQSLARAATLQADLQVMSQKAADLDRDMKIERGKSNEVIGGQLSQLQILKKQLQEKDTQLTSANTQISALRKQLDEANAATSELQKERDDLLKEKDRLSSLLQLSESDRVKQLIEQTVTLSKQLRISQEKISNLSKDNEDTKEELLNTTNELAIAKSALIKLKQEKRSQEERMAELALRLKAEDKSLADGKSSASIEETNMLREMIKRQMQAQERNKKATALLLEAAKATDSSDQQISQAMALLDQDVQLTDEEKKLLLERRPDDEFIAPTAKPREEVIAATGELQAQVENFKRVAQRAFAAGRLNACKEILDTSLDLHPGKTDTMVSLGVVEMKLGEFPAAEQSLIRAVEMDATNANSHRLLGLTRYNMNDLEKAKESLVRSLEINPNDASSLTVLGNTYLRLKQKVEAEKCYKSAITTDPSISEPCYNLALLYFNQKRKEEARLCYKEALNKGAAPDPALEAQLIR